MTRYGGSEPLPDDLDALTAGDRIGQSTIARTIQQYNGDPDAWRLVVVSELRLGDDAHSAFVAAPDSGYLLRVDCAARGHADTPADRDWTVRDIGRDVGVVDAELDYDANDRDPDPDPEFVANWVRSILLARAERPGKLRDEIYVEHGARVEVFDPTVPRRGYCSVALGVAR